MILEKCLSTLNKFRMVEPGETVLVAVSGGCDSVVLLMLLLQLKVKYKLQLSVVHVNHRLRKAASDLDERFVRQLCRRHKLPFFCARFNVKQKAKEEKVSIEEAARSVRYDFFERIAESEHAQKVAIAHTRDDQAETVLMRVINGTGLQGLQAIRPKRPLNNQMVIRPLIEVGRAEIRDYAKRHKIRYREDASNRSLQYMRNRIRLKLIPMLEKNFNPQVKKALSRLPHLLDVDLSFLEETAELFYKRLAKKTSGNDIVFPRQSFQQLRPSIQYRLLGRAMRTLARTELDFDHWNDFSSKLTIDRRFKNQLPKGLFVSVSPIEIRVHSSAQSKNGFHYQLEVGDELYIPEIGKILKCEVLEEKPILRKSNPNYEIFDLDRIDFPLEIRNRIPGDRFQPLGQKRALKLKGFLINKHVPSQERERIPLIVSQNKIIWVGGIAMGESAKIDDQSTNFVQLSLCSSKAV